MTRDRHLLVSSLVLNWVVGPAGMFALAWALLPDQPAYRTGLIVSIGPIATLVTSFLGIPLVVGFLTRVIGERANDITG